jgi:hypothetical protein
MSDKKAVLYIDSESLIMLGIDPDEGVKYLENKEVMEMSPVHFKTYQILKQQAVPSS